VIPPTPVALFPGRPLLMLLLATTNFGVVGCDEGVKIAPVSGRVTLDGVPLEGARINTQPVSQAGEPSVGVGSFAVTDAEGRYHLELVTPPRPGAVIGEHSVLIKLPQTRYVAGREDAPIVGLSVLPPEALDGSICLNVPQGGLDKADFDLRSRSQK
jgi:hypothetical protein